MQNATADTQEKPHLSLVVCGHVDAGKSPTTGHLLFELGGIAPREMDKLKEKAAQLGKASFSFAFFMDTQKDERERGVTISCTTKEFFTTKYHYTIIDAPGHRDFVKNMISGAGQADVALLMVPADKGGFEKAVAKGNRATGEVEGQTRQHSRLINLLGVEQVIVGINKMDNTSPTPYLESRFREIASEVVNMLKAAGYKDAVIANFPFVPISGWHGDNLVKKSDKMPWYKGCDITKDGVKMNVHTLEEAFNDACAPPKRTDDGAMRCCVSGVYKIKGVGDVITGRVEQGKMKPEDKVKFVPSDGKMACKGKIFTIEMHHKHCKEARAGDNVGLNVKGLSKENMPRVGDIITLDSDKLSETTEFTMQVAVQEHPGQLKAGTWDEKKKEYRGGFSPIAFCRTARAPVQMSKIDWKMGKKSTGGAKVEDAPYVEKSDMAQVVFTPKGPIVVTPFKDCPGLGRIAIMDSNALVMLGKVVKANYR
jgi:elongation factor 1-alpha